MYFRIEDCADAAAHRSRTPRRRRATIGLEASLIEEDIYYILYNIYRNL